MSSDSRSPPEVRLHALMDMVSHAVPVAPEDEDSEALTRANQLMDFLDNTEQAHRAELFHELADIAERLYDLYLQCDPDPLDDQTTLSSPPRTRCEFRTLTVQMRNRPNFLDTAMNDDMVSQVESIELSKAAARLFSTVAEYIPVERFVEEEQYVSTLFSFANSEEDQELQMYAVGVLDSLLNTLVGFDGFDEQRIALVSVLIRKLYGLHGRPGDQLLLEQPPSSPAAAANPGTRYFLRPLNVDTCHRFILTYLSHDWCRPEIIPFTIEADLLPKMVVYFDGSMQWHPCTVFQAVQCIGAMVTHPKHARAFVSAEWIDLLLRLQPESMPAVAIPGTLGRMAAQEAMENLYSLPDEQLSKLVSFLLRILDCSHQSARYDASEFLGFCFTEPRLLKLFDKLQGLRTICNNLARAKDNAPIEGNSNVIIFSWTTMAPCFAMSLQKYLESHMIPWFEKLREHWPVGQVNVEKYCRIVQSPTRDLVGNSRPPFGDYDYAKECVELLRETLPLYTQDWQPIKVLRQHKAIDILLKLAHLLLNTPSQACKPDVLSTVLRVIWYASASPRVQLDFTSALEVGNTKLFRREIIACAQNCCWKTSSAKRIAIDIIANCVCGGYTKYVSVAQEHDPQNAYEYAEMLQMAVWDCVRQNEGIQVLLSALEINETHPDLDLVQISACQVASVQALRGLAQHKPVQQILSKLPIISDGSIFGLIKDNVRLMNRPKILELRSEVSALVKQVTGQETFRFSDSISRQLYKQNVVANTDIQIYPVEIVVLMFRELIKNKFYNTASQLLIESGLAVQSDGQQESESSKTGSSRTRQPSNSDLSSSPAKVMRVSSSSSSNDKKSEDAAKESIPTDNFPACSLTIEGMLKEHFRNQHAQCPMPISACPPFSVFTTHKCPEVKARSEAPYNLTTRVYERQYFPRCGGRRGFQKDLSLVYSRLRWLKACEEFEGLSDYTTCTFTSDGSAVVLGTYGGDVCWYEIHSTTLPPSLKFHNHPISIAQESKDRKILLTATFSRFPRGVVWRHEDGFVPKISLTGDRYVEFDKTNETRIIGSEKSIAKVYDLNTGNVVVRFYDEDLANNYCDNRATFYYDDSLVLSDGILWDVRTGNAVHKFDKLTPQASGVFHPNKLDVLIDKEVWDLRTFRLKHMVESLHRRKVVFNASGNILYSILRKFAGKDLKSAKFDSMVSVYDASDFSLISNLPQKKPVLDICVDPMDNYLSVLESKSVSSSSLFDDNVCRIYSIGKTKDSLTAEMESISDMENDEQNDSLFPTDDDDDDDSGGSEHTANRGETQSVEGERVHSSPDNAGSYEVEELGSSDSVQSSTSYASDYSLHSSSVSS